MERFFKRKLSSTLDDTSNVGEQSLRENVNTVQPSYSPVMPKKIDLKDLPWDPFDRKRIIEYHPDQRDEIRRAYLIRGPCQPLGHEFPKTKIGNKDRRFNPEWYEKYKNWLEYSLKADKAYCLYCYLFRDHFGRQGGSDAFVVDGFCGWNKTERLGSHVGEVNSFHHKALKKCDDLLRQKQSIPVAFHKQSDIVKNEHRIRLNASIDVSRFLLNSALPFRGHDESEKSLHRGNFLEMIKYTQNQNEMIRKVTLKNAPGNNQMVSPKIQKDICHCFAQEILKSIMKEIGDDVFALLVDESSDVSKKEQMAVVLRYVDDTSGVVKERFVGLVHVKETSSLTLKYAIDNLFAEFGLSLKQALQRKDQDILNAISLVESTKRQLQEFRVHGRDSLLKKVFSFCDKYDIEKLDMTEAYVNPKNRRKKTGITNEHYYSFDCFNVVVDMQIAEFNDRFNEKMKTRREQI
ncbi:zinc finger MYM-type protein 1-like [Heracleum sosnowskyi]|uniref:Zinc finger MYM-type protein 1-like n=1 Tax=Heracleum sosnowskyi TaxID=360622 RepID=A0AAD8GMY7_9APIA|nr:zinc finger MYM-type protein 1-like [Heracleum sosnowskyi]